MKMTVKVLRQMLENLNDDAVIKIRVGLAEAPAESLTNYTDEILIEG